MESEATPLLQPGRTVFDSVSEYVTAASNVNLEQYCAYTPVQNLNED